MKETKLTLATKRRIGRSKVDSNPDDCRSETTHPKSACNVLERLKELGRTGRYLEAIKTHLASNQVLKAASERDGVSLNGALQYAIALQHAGYFQLARETYRQVIEKAELGKLKIPGTLRKSIVLNARVQEAVLLERLGRPAEALRLLADLGPISPSSELNLARASVASWIDLASLNSAFALKRYAEVARVAKRCSRAGDWNQQLWGRLFEAFLVHRSTNSKSERLAACSNIESIIKEVSVRDPPGMPWFGLATGRALSISASDFARSALETAHVAASRMGKFFLIAATSEELHAIHARTRANRIAQVSIRRAVQAYARCGLLQLSPFRERLYERAQESLGEAGALDLFMRSLNLVPPQQLVFSRMCRDVAARRTREGNPTKDWQIFEEFVRAWAPTRYPGRLRTCEPGRSTADVILVDRAHRATLLQAKHHTNPLKYLPTRLHLREIAKDYDVEIVRYVYVVSTRAASGWTDGCWNVQASKTIENLVPDSHIAVDVVIETELQSDTLLEPSLYEQFFRDISR